MGFFDWVPGINGVIAVNKEATSPPVKNSATQNPLYKIAPVRDAAIAINKAKMDFYQKFGKFADVVDKNVAEPALEFRNAVVDAFKKSVNVFNFRLVLIVAGLFAGAYILSKLRR